VVRLCLLFFLSGASGLIYQVVWVREFGNVFGNTLYSASLVVAVFMAGLGFGGYVAGRWADRRYAARPESLLATYGYFELGIGVLGFLVSLLLPRLGAVAAAISSYTQDARGWYVLSPGSYLARYAIAVAVLVPITLLMGGTLTVLIRHVVRRDVESAGRRIGALYGANTAGAALGCFLTDYAFIPAGGLQATQMIAVLLNLVAAAGALRLASRQSRAPDQAGATADRVQPAPSDSSRVVALTGAAIVLSGFAAMGIEIVWFRHVNVLAGSLRSVLSLILTVILAGIWIGSIAGGFLHARFGRPAMLYMLAQGVFVISTLTGLATADFGRDLAEQTAAYPAYLASSGWRRDALELWLVVRPLLRELGIPALAMGFAYPLANACIQDAERVVGRRAGLLYLANTVGALAGALAAGFVLLPRLGMQGSVTVLVVVAALAIVPLYVAFGVGPVSARHRRPAAAAFALTLAATATAIALWIALPARHLLDHALWPPGPNERRLHVSEGITEIVTVTDVPGQGRALMTNGHLMSGTNADSQRYMRAFAHLPLLSMDAPERVVVICFGVGNTLHAASLHPSVRRLEVVDISRQILEHAGWFSATNHDVIDDPRLSVYVNDGRHHLRMQPPGTYDLITLEPPPILFAGVASLYSRDFYALARSRLKPGGYLTQWLPLPQAPAEATLEMVRAFVEVFPQAVLLSGTMTDFILMGTNGPRLELQPAKLRARLAGAPAVRDDMRAIGLGSLVEIAGTFAGSAETLARATDIYPPLTDDYPITEYAKVSRLRADQVPVDLFDVRTVTAWCPSCFVNGAPAAGLEGLRDYLAVLGGFYLQPAFVEVYWPYPPPGRSSSYELAIGPKTRAVIADSPYLRRLISPEGRGATDPSAAPRDGARR